MKIDIACGGSCAEGYEGVDIAKVNDKVKHVVNLYEFPWPFKDESIEEIRNSHFIEHIPQMFWNPDPIGPSYGPAWTRHLTPFQIDDKSISLFLKFFAECWRILKPGGKIQVICPHGRSNRALQDSTHTRSIVEESFDYLDHEWRKVNKLQHAAYGAGALFCHFPVAEQHRGASTSPYQAKTLSLMAEQVQHAAVQRYWNMLSDFDVTLVKAPIPIEVSKEAPKAEPAEVTA